MSKKLSSELSLQALNLQTVEHNSFTQVKQVVECLADYPDSPRTVAILSLFFVQINSDVFQEKLLSWLRIVTSDFIGEPIRNQSDQAEKILAIATYCYLLDKTRDLSNQEKKNLNQFFEYAAKHNWLDDTFLAFYCSLLTEDIALKDKIVTFFENNFESFIKRRNITALAQAVLVLNTRLTDLNRRRVWSICFDSIEQMSLVDASWTLWALSNNVTTEEMNLCGILTSMIYKQLDNYLFLSRQENPHLYLVAMFGNIDSLMHYNKDSVVNNETDSITLTLKHKSTGDQALGNYTLIELGIALCALVQSHSDQLVGVKLPQKAQLAVCRKSNLYG